MRVDIDGLTEVRLSFVRMDAGIPEMVRKTTADAADKVAMWGRIGFPIGPSSGGHAVTSIRASRGTVTEGGSAFPYVGWLDFGGRVGINGDVFRPFIHRGRFIWAALGDHHEQVQHVFEEGLRELARRSGLDVE